MNNRNNVAEAGNAMEMLANLFVERVRGGPVRLEAAARREPGGKTLASRRRRVCLARFCSGVPAAVGGRARTLMEQALPLRLDACHNRSQAPRRLHPHCTM